jgi:hypothetical protein
MAASKSGGGSNLPYIYGDILFLFDDPLIPARDA